MIWTLFAMLNKFVNFIMFLKEGMFVYLSPQFQIWWPIRSMQFTKLQLSICETMLAWHKTL